jgi:hypothetical protein
MPTLAKLARWLFQKLAGAALIIVLGLAAYGLWLFLRENVDMDRQQAETLRLLQVKRAELVKAQADVEKRLVDLRAGIAEQQERAQRAQKVLDQLRELESWWERWWPWGGGANQQKANQEQMQRMSELAKESTKRLGDLRRMVTQTSFEKQGVDAELTRVDGEIGAVERARSEAVFYWRRAWDKGKWYVLIAVGSYLVGPTLWALLMYYGLAALVARGRPIQFTSELPPLPQVSESRVSSEVTLRAGDLLRIREKFLQASDEGVTKRTRFVLDWRIPFTSLASGLVELVELGGASGAGEYRVTLSNSVDPHIELAQVDIPEGASLILRPSFLAGVIQRMDAPLQIRRRWQILRWQAWVTGQFRFFEFVGPCRLIVAGSRGVRAEVLAEREGIASPARRTNQDATIGFTPNLEYRPVRAETFWSYYRGMNPLFDDLFAGRGLFLLQETATEGAAAKAGQFWSTLWNGVLKVFGL